MKKLLAVTFLLAFVIQGCALFDNAGKPYDETRGDPNVQQQLRFLKFTAKLGCTVEREEGKPEDIANTKKAVNYAKAVLDSDSPSWSSVEVIVNEFMPEKAKVYVVLALDEAKNEFGELILDKESTAFQALSNIVLG